MSKLLLTDLNLKNKKVLLRVDFNVPLDDDQTIADDTRIRLALPTIQYILDKGASLILMSHLGRPKGEKDAKFSLKPCAIHLEKLLEKKVVMADDCVGSEVENLAKNLQCGQILMLENLRFYEAEEKPDKDPNFAEKLASLADIYVNDAFGTAHRSHSSTAVISKYFPNCAAMGFLMKKELEFLCDAMQSPKKPFYALLGGAKVSTKIGILKSLLNKVDAFFIGGGMAYTFLKAQGINIGESLVDNEMLDTASTFLKSAEKQNVKVYLPEDIVIADNFSNDANFKTISTANGIPDSWRGMDLGKKTIQDWSSHFQKCHTIFWNGPLGVFEFNNFSHSTYEIAKTLGNLSAVTIVGGGDSVAAINHLNLEKSYTHVSTGGGASLELLEHGHLPGVDALSDQLKKDCS